MSASGIVAHACRIYRDNIQQSQHWLLQLPRGEPLAAQWLRAALARRGRIGPYLHRKQPQSAKGWAQTQEAAHPLGFGGDDHHLDQDVWVGPDSKACVLRRIQASGEPRNQRPHMFASTVARAGLLFGSTQAPHTCSRHTSDPAMRLRRQGWAGRGVGAMRLRRQGWGGRGPHSWRRSRPSS